MFKKIAARLWRRLFHWWSSGPPNRFLFVRARQRRSVRTQEKENLQRYREQAARIPVLDVDSIFLHIPKCAGTSMNSSLQAAAGFVMLPDYFEGKILGGANRRFISPHYHLDWFVQNKLISRPALERAYSFSIVRHPLARVASLYRYLIEGNRLDPTWTFETFLLHVRRESPLVGGCKVARLSQAAPQMQWLNQRLWSGFTEVLKLEQIESWRSKVETRLDASLLLPVLNKTSRPKLTFSDVEVQLVSDIYAEDFEHLGYEVSNVF